MDYKNDDLNYGTLTFSQSLLTGTAAGAASSLINHPFQVLRARFQNYLALKAANPNAVLAPVFTLDPKILFRGFPSTLLSMCSLTITQVLAKHHCSGNEKESLYVQMGAPLFGGFASAVLTTPLEGGLLRQSRTMPQDKQYANVSILEQSRQFYQQHGLRKFYAGGLAVGIRTSLVGSGFSLWAPHLANRLEQHGVSSPTSMIISGMVTGTFFAAISQPPETLRIEQQFTADTKAPLTIRQAFRLLIEERGLLGLFKGGTYRIPRTAPGIFINAVVYSGLKNHFEQKNQLRM